MHIPTPPIDDLFIIRLNEVQNDHESGNFGAAERGYRELIDKQPALWQLHFNLGLLLFDLERYDEALKCYLDGLAVHNKSIDLLYNCAICFKKLDRLGEAIDSYRKALTIDPADTDCRYNLAGCLQAYGKETEALTTYLEILDSYPEHVPSLNNAAYLFHKNGANEQAQDHYRRILQIDPDHAAADHMLAALTGVERDAAPEAYVRDVFDQFAGHYEASLTGNLHYCLPTQLFDFYRSLTENKAIDHLLDLGCGTGLVGEKFQSTCATMTGVDLSEKMVVSARLKNIYDALYVSDIVSFLEKNQYLPYDLIISGDVFPYLGDLTPVFIAALRCAGPGTYFIFSVEHDGTENERPQLQKSGRFTHSRRYIGTVAVSTGWKAAGARTIDLRKERDTWIKGSIYALVRS